MSLGQEHFLVLYLIRKIQRGKCHHTIALSLGEVSSHHCFVFGLLLPRMALSLFGKCSFPEKCKIG